MVGEKNVTRIRDRRFHITFLRGEKMKNGNGVQWEKWGAREWRREKMSGIDGECGGAIIGEEK
jgi:hypothetical protein